MTKKTSSINGSEIVHFSKGTSVNLGKAPPKAESLNRFYKMFHEALMTGETFRQFDKLGDEGQKQKKQAAGFWYRAPTKDGIRNAKSALPSNLVSLDFDYIDVEFWDAVRTNSLDLPFEYAYHTSRRHTPEKPRFRVIIPLAKMIDNDRYPAVSRILASKFDPEMTRPDKVSFRPAQMMFLPTRCRDGEYVFGVMENELADPDDLLDEFEMVHGDWRDISNLPKAPNEKLRETADKAEDPTEKLGPVGNFCRAYDVETAIERFGLPYEPVDIPSGKPRYTYLGGTTTNGAEVQDDGLFLYSHHGSDPCADMLVNAFDLVRIHKFGKEDEKFNGEGKKANEYPSYKAMVEFISDDPAYRKEVVASNYDTNEMFDDLWDEDEVEIEDDEIDAMVGTVPQQADDPEDDEDDDEEDVSDLVGEVPEKALGKAILKPMKPRKRPRPEKDWVSKLEADRAGKIIPNIANLARILSADPRFMHSIAYNEFHARTVCRVPLRTKIDWLTPPPVMDKENGDPWQDYHENVLRAVLESEAGQGKKGWGMRVTDRDLGGAVDIAARDFSFHPVRERLESFDWDKNRRVDTLFIDYLGCPDTPYYREAARMFMVAAVTRVFEPGHKFDYVPTLWGAQGKRKSTFINVLALGWAGELKANFSDEKAMVEQMMGCVIMELPELSSIGRSAVEDVKAFISATESNVRLAYRRNSQVFKRQCVFMGSTNQKDFLKDQTGNRRFWPIEVVVDSIDTDKLRRTMPQIWAEAVALYKAMRKAQPEGMLPLYLTSNAAAEEALKLQNDSLRENDADMAAAIIEERLNKKVRVGDDFDEANGKATYEWPEMVFSHAIATDWLDGVKVTGQMSQVVAEALQKLGWEKVGRRRAGNGYRGVAYVPGPEQIARWEEIEAAEQEEEPGNVVTFSPSK